MIKREIDIEEFCKWRGFDDDIISLLKEKHTNNVDNQIDFISHINTLFEIDWLKKNY